MTIPSTAAEVEADASMAAPDDAVGSKAPWAALGALVLCYVFNSADRQILSILQEPIAKDLNLSDSALGALGLFFAISYTLATFPLAALSDRGGARRVIALTFGAWSVMTIACGAATSFLTLGLGRAGVALGEAGSAPASHAFVSRRFPVRLRTTAMGVLLIGGISGTALASGIAGWIAHEYDWRIAFYVFGAVGVAVTPLVWLFLGTEHDAKPLATSAVRPRGGELPRVLRAFWQQRSLRYLCLAAAGTALGGGGANHWIASLLIRSHGLTVAEAGATLFAAILIGGVAGALLSGVIADRWGGRDARGYVGVPFVSLLIGVAALTVVATAPSANVAVGAFGVFAFVTNGVLAPLFALVQRLAPEDGRATAAAFLMVTMQVVGMALGPLLFGIASDVAKQLGGVDTLKTAILFGAGALALAALAAGRVLFTIRADLAAREAS
jgi:predicted MFS family arabinose efflux permease